MKLKLSKHFTMPAASLYLFEISMLLILIPIADRIIYPALRYFGFDFTPLRKMGVGMLFATGSVIMAGLMEIERKKYIDSHGYFEQHPFDTPVNASQMNIFYQVPQYVLQGTGEVLTAIPGTCTSAKFFIIAKRNKKNTTQTMHTCIAQVLDCSFPAIFQQAKNGDVLKKACSRAVCFPHICQQSIIGLYRNLSTYFFF